MKPAIRFALQHNEHIRDWREFWRTDGAEYVGNAFLIEVGDAWATVRDTTTHQLLDQFVIDTMRDEIFERLAHLLLNHAPK